MLVQTDNCLVTVQCFIVLSVSFSYLPSTPPPFLHVCAKRFASPFLFYPSHTTIMHLFSLSAAAKQCLISLKRILLAALKTGIFRITLTISQLLPQTLPLVLANHLHAPPTNHALSTKSNLVLPTISSHLPLSAYNRILHPPITNLLRLSTTNILLQPMTNHLIRS